MQLTVFFTLCWRCPFQSMASTISLLPERHFLCPLCSGIFTSPVTIPCGHSFCLSCLCRYWGRHQSKYCPQCKRVFTDRPDLSVNRTLAYVSDHYRKARPQKPAVKEMVLVAHLSWWRCVLKNKSSVSLHAWIPFPGNRHRANGSGKTAEDRKVEIFPWAPEGAVKNLSILCF